MKGATTQVVEPPGLVPPVSPLAHVSSFHVLFSSGIQKVSFREDITEVGQKIMLYLWVWLEFIKVIGNGKSSKSSPIVCIGQTEDVKSLRQTDHLIKKIDDAHQVFIKTEGFKHARDRLADEYQHQLILLGSPGCGKTTISPMLMREYIQKDYSYHFIDSIDNNYNIIDTVDTSTSNILVFDDFFGRSGLFDIDKWIKVLRDLDVMFMETAEKTSQEVNKPDLKVIFTSRDYSFKKAQPFLEEYANTIMKQSNVVDLSTFRLNETERKDMLLSHCKVAEVAMQDDLVMAIVNQTKNVIGFPYCCKLFLVDKMFQRHPKNLFSNPFVYFKKILRTLLLLGNNREQAAALVLTVLLDGKLTVPELYPHTRKRLDMEEYLNCLVPLSMPNKPEAIIRGAKSLNGTHLNTKHKTYVFCHPTLYDAIACIMAEHYPNVVLRHCTMKFIQEFLQLQTKCEEYTAVSSYDYSCSVSIPNEHSDMFAWRLATEINQCNYIETLQHDVLRQDNFVDELIEKLREESAFPEMFHKTDKTHGQSFLFWATLLSPPYIVNIVFGHCSFEEHELVEGFLGCARSGNTRSLYVLTEKSTSSFVLDRVTSATIGDILQTESNAEKHMQLLSVPSERKGQSLSNNPFLCGQNDGLLHLACIQAHCDVVEMFLKLGCPVDARGELGRTPVMYASRLGHDKVADILLKAGADINIMDEKRACALRFAICGGHINVAKIFLENGVNINERGEYVRTPLFYACCYGNSQLVEFCLENGADTSLKCTTSSCLHLACKSGNLETVKILLDKDMAINEPGQFRRTPIMYACRYGHLDIVNHMRLKGADLKIVDDLGEDIFHLSVLSGNVDIAKEMLPPNATRESVCGSEHKSPFENASRKGHYDMLKYFIDNKKELVPVPLCLMSACYYGHLTLIKMLIDMVDDINEKGKKGRTALISACLGGQTETAELLISKGADVHLVDDYDISCWHYACDTGRVNLVELLLKQGFTVNTPCQNWMTSLMIACRRNHKDLFEFLVEYDRNVVHTLDKFGLTCLHHSCVGKHDNPEILEMLFHRGMNNVNCRDNGLKTPAMYASRSGRTDILHYLVDRGADLNLKDKPGQTCLHYACFSKNEDIISYLVGCGVYINCEDNKKKTPLMTACFRGNSVAVHVLLELGADDTKLNVYTEACVHTACREGHVEVVEVLVRHGVDMEMEGKFGRTPFMYACQYGKIDVVNYLRGISVTILAADENGANSLHLSCMGKNDDCSVASKLIEFGINVNSRDRSRMTPIMHACSHGHSQLFEFLYSKGANIALQDRRGTTCLDFARKRGHHELAKKIIILKSWASGGERETLYFLDLDLKRVFFEQSTVEVNLQQLDGHWRAPARKRKYRTVDATIRSSKDELISHNITDMEYTDHIDHNITDMDYVTVGCDIILLFPELSNSSPIVCIGQTEDIKSSRQRDHLIKKIDDAHQVFIKTEGFKHARDYLGDEHQHQLILLDAPGCGKTTISLMLMREYIKKDYSYHFIDSIDNYCNIVDMVDTNTSNILVFDDFFGRSGLFDIDKWIKVLRDLDVMFMKAAEETSQNVNKTDLKVIFTSRGYIFKKSQPYLDEYANTIMKQSNVVDLSTFHLNETERKDMLLAHCKVVEVAMQDDLVKTIVNQTENIIGFPYCCKMFQVDKMFQRHPEKLFSNPFVYFKKNLKTLLLSGNNREQAAALVLTVLLDGKLKVPDLYPQTRKRPDMEKYLNCLVHLSMPNMPEEIIKGAKSLNGTYLNIEHKTYVFCHPTLYDAIACIMAEHYPNVVLQYCTMKFIQEFLQLQTKREEYTGVSSYDYSCSVSIPIEHSDMFAWRFANEINQCNYSETLQHDVLRQDDFVDELIEKLIEESTFPEMFHKTDKTHGQCFLFWATLLSPPYIVKIIFKNSNFEERELLEGFLGCARSGNTRSLDVLAENSTSSFIRGHVTSATIGDIQQTESNAEKHLKSLSVPIEKQNECLSNNPFVGAQNDGLLHLACIHAHCDVTKRLLKLGCPVDALGELGRTPLMYASRLGHYEVADILLKAGANINIIDEEGACALHLAARGGHIDVAKIFLENDVDINEKGEHNRTPLLYACRYGYVEFVKFCLENKGDMKLKCQTDSCLHLACKSGSIDTVKILLDNDILPRNKMLDINEPGHFRRTPIMYACLHGKTDIVNYLMTNGAELDTLDERGENIIHMAVLSGNVELVKELLSCSKTQHLLSSLNGSSVFERASANGRYDMLKYFIESNKKLVPLSPCLIVACFKGHMPIIEMLIDIVDDVDYRGHKGRTALLTACLGGQTETARFLISKGADNTLLDEFNDSCWKHACDSGKVDLVSYLLEHSEFTVGTPCQNGMTSFMIACRRNHTQLFEFLVEQDTYAVHTLDTFGSSCLHHCCTGRHDSTLLLERLVALNLDVNCTDNNEKTPLMQAFQNGCIEIVRWLVEHGADLCLTDKRRGNYLHYACRSNKVENIKFLLHCGFPVNCTDQKNNTPLMEACFKGNSDVVDLLLQNGADANRQNTSGETCVGAALKKKHETVLQVLANYGFNTNI
ncbi:uncharacterized protein LOC121373126 [Gigantopelta aegis]|uniref:uncharacterized protein LOC121373126 n=1 Tax=Gigantopelta aegis TaxID=1735272 RepID=UPI001B88D248|nr:uncharacterized protein LOC121373126 [Gigantopelta aegis]